jgi:hypothetical protein
VTYSAGGLGGGGNASRGAGANATANTGNGAQGAAGGTGLGGNGGSGIVILRYSSTFDDLTTIGAGLTYTKTTSGGYKIYQFTAGTGTVTK